MGRSVPDLIWCGTSAPVVQGFLVGLGLLAVGLTAFPYRVRLSDWTNRPAHRLQRARRAAAHGRVVSWLLVPLVTGTVIGYIWIYILARGRFCDAVLTPNSRRIIVVWTAVAGLTALTLVAAAVLRATVRRHDPDD